MIRKFRDISIIELDGRTITVACDSCSGVGKLGHDLVPWHPAIPQDIELPL